LFAIIVVSLFDGMSCGQLGAKRAGTNIDKYYASEIKKNAIKVTQKHFPNTIQIGDVTKVRYRDGVLYTEKEEYEVGKIDLLMGGSPCQDFSSAKILDPTTQEQKGLEGEKSKLFYHYLRIKNEIDPTYFLLENVKMKKQSERELNEYMGVDGMHINSSLVSFQDRHRIYWTNIEGVEPPEDRGINFQDYKDTDPEYCRQFKVKSTPGRVGWWNEGKGRVPKFKGDNTAKYCENVTHAAKIKTLTRKQDRSPNSGLVQFEDFCRYLTRREIELAQTLPLGYTDGLSYPQMQDVCGDGWTVDVIAHILSYIK
jgi:site-specific DNA-cytosine methylase